MKVEPTPIVEMKHYEEYETRSIVDTDAERMQLKVGCLTLLFLLILMIYLVLTKFLI